MGRPRKQVSKPEAEESFAEIASVKGASHDSLAKLKAEIADLQSRLDASEAQRSEAEAAALARAEAQGGLMQREIEEIPSGRKVEVMRLDHYKRVGHKDDGRPILEPVMKAVKLDTYFYKIDMPPCGGTDLKINGQAFYHGATYEFDIDTLRTIKEIVFRTWKHDSDIHGSDENFYRKPQQSRLSARGMA